MNPLVRRKKWKLRKEREETKCRCLVIVGSPLADLVSTELRLGATG